MITASCFKCGQRLEVPITTRPAQVICSNCYNNQIQKQRLEGYNIPSGEYMKQ
jgi:hypothetical protein